MSENKTINPKLEAALKGIWDSLTDEQKEKAKNCKTMDELTALAAKEGIELPDEVLDAVAGGYIYHDYSKLWPSEYPWVTVDDKTGDVLGRFVEKSTAERIAAEKGQSQQEIDQMTWANICRQSQSC